MNIAPDFGDPEECAFCGNEARGVALLEDGHWVPSCTDCIEDDQPYRGAS